MLYYVDNAVYKFNRVKLYRRNFDKNSNSCFDEDHCFGEIIVVETAFGARELLTGTHIKCAKFIDESDYGQGVWENVPNSACIGQYVDEELTESDIVLYIKTHQYLGFEERLNDFIYQSRMACIQHKVDSVKKLLRIKK
jgi:hypothetical protein